MAKKPAPRKSGTSARSKSARPGIRTAPKKKAPAKKPAPARKTAAPKKAAPARKAAAPKKAAPARKAAAPKKTAPARKAAAPKKAAPARKAAAPKRAAPARKAAAPKKTAPARKAAAPKKAAPARKAAAPKKAAPARKAAAPKRAAPARKAAAPKKTAPARKAAAPKKIGNPSGTVRAAMPSSLATPPASTGIDTGRAELRQKVRQHTSTSPTLTGGDVDADWGRADAVGDEAPGGDNPTPDQDVVEEIGRALGVEYDDDEELRGGDEIADRDRHRWELDPESSEDFDDR